MNKLSALISGLAAGAGCMYFLDPNHGRRRRALLKDKANRIAHQAECNLEIAMQDMRNRIQGIATEAQHFMQPKQHISDDILVERIRSKLGRYTSHPRAVEVHCQDGCVTLKGEILTQEVQPMVNAIKSMEGVCSVENQLMVRNNPQESPRLQGGRQRPGEHINLFDNRWAPATKLMISIGGLLVALNGLRHGGLMKILMGGLGAAMISETVSGQSLYQAGSRNTFTQGTRRRQNQQNQQDQQQWQQQGRQGQQGQQRRQNQQAPQPEFLQAQREKQPPSQIQQAQPQPLEKQYEKPVEIPTAFGEDPYNI